MGALYFEISKELGSTPLFVLENCNGETIIDVPYTHIILTPAKNQHREAQHHEQIDGKTPHSSAGNPKDRPGISDPIRDLSA